MMPGSRRAWSWTLRAARWSDPDRGGLGIAGACPAAVSRSVTQHWCSRMTAWQLAGSVCCQSAPRSGSSTLRTILSRVAVFGGEPAARASLSAVSQPQRENASRRAPWPVDLTRFWKCSVLCRSCNAEVAEAMAMAGGLMKARALDAATAPVSADGRGRWTTWGCPDSPRECVRLLSESAS